jgi:hypothetical protein
MDFDPDEIIGLAGREMTARTAVRRLMANPPQHPSEFTIVRDGKQSVLTIADVEILASKWGVALRSDVQSYRD